MKGENLRRLSASELGTYTMAYLEPNHPFNKHPLKDFLWDRFTKNSREATITGMGELRGSWLVNDDDYPKLLDLLHDYLFAKGHRALGFVEQPRLEGAKPLLIDLDFHYSKSKALVRSFVDENIRDFCKAIAEAYSYFFDMSSYESLRFFVTLRPQPYPDKEKIKDGIHIECPDAPLTNEKWNVIRNYILKKKSVSAIFGYTDYINVPDENVYDAAMGRKQGWMFYGASKPSIPAYELTNIFVYTPETGEWADEDINNYSSRQLLELFSVRYEVQDDINDIREDKKDEYEAIAHPPQPRFEPAVTAALETETTNNQTINALVSMLPLSEGDDAVLKAMVLQCLTVARAEDYHSWIRVGWCLHNIATTDEMFDLWMEFSKKSPKFKENDIGKLRRDWHIGMRKEGDGPRLGIRSLYKWARDDNLERYNQIIAEDTDEYIIKQTDTTHYHISKLMKKMYGTVFIASVTSRTTEWYHYDDAMNMWRHLNQGMEFRKKICIDVADQIQSACSRIGRRWANAANEDERRQNAEKLKQLHEMQTKLYNSGFNDSVMKMNGVMFYEDEFMNKLNINPYLFGCANGVLELRHKAPHDTREHVIFRQGRPEDYVSFLAGKNLPDFPSINYAPYDPTDPRQAEIQDFFTKLFPRPDLKKHVLKLLAACLEGTNREQLFYFFIGVGSNGKSKLVKLMELTFGDYQTPLQATVFTRKRPESGAANPDLIVIKARRFIYSQEPDDKEPLNTSRMKQMSGEDMIEARALFQDQERFKVMGRIFMMCNRLPPIHSMDNGTWRRIRVIPFESRFEPEDHPDYIAKKEHVYLRDNYLDDKLMSWREPFLAYLVHLYETEYIPNGLKPEPSVVKQESEKYKTDHDSFAKFRLERIRELRDGFTEVTNETVTLKEIIKAQSSWAVATGGKKMDPKELEHRCEEAFGDSRGKKVYTHIRVFKEESDVDEFDTEHKNPGGELTIE